MSTWEWIPTDEEGSKSMSFPGVLPDDDTTYNGREAYDNEEPLMRYRFRASGVPKADKNAIRAAYLARKTKYPLTDKLGDSYDGYMTAYRASNVNGSTYFQVEIEITVVQTEL